MLRILRIILLYTITTKHADIIFAEDSLKSTADSSMLIIFSNNRTRGMDGEVKINDEVRDESARFRKLIAYIPQDEELRMALTAKESMMFAANLKLGYSVSTEYKVQQVSYFCSNFDDSRFGELQLPIPNDVTCVTEYYCFELGKISPIVLLKRNMFGSSLKLTKQK